VVTSSLVHFILRIILGKELGPDGLGVYTLAFTFYTLGINFAAFGIGPAMTKYVAQFLDDQSTIRKYVSSGMTSSILTGTLMGIALLFSAPYIAGSFFHVPELGLLIQLIAVAFPFIAIQKVVLGTLNGFRRMHLFALLNIVQNVSIVGVSVILVLGLNMGVLGGVLGLVGPTMVISLVSLTLIRGSLDLELGLHHRLVVWETTVFGFYVVLANSISFINGQIGNILIGFYLTPSEVGIYAVAVLFSTVLTLLPSSIQLVTAAATANLYGKNDIPGIRRLVFSTIRKMFLISAGIALLLVILGPLAISILFSPEFGAAYTPLLILLLGNTIYSSYMAVGATLTNIGKVHIISRISAIGCVLNVTLTVLLVPVFGIIGAAMAQAATLLTNYAINLTVINRYLR
jgi:O-antigen/teichoic acid export membrane protein